MSGELIGHISRKMENISSVTRHNCYINREPLATKMPEELKKKVKISIFIKARSLNSRIFDQILSVSSDAYTNLTFRIFEIKR